MMIGEEMKMYEGPTDIAMGKVPEQREFKGYSFLTEVLIPMAQAGVAGLSLAGLETIKWIVPVLLVAFVLALALDAVGIEPLWAGILFVAWLAWGAYIALTETFALLHERMSTEAKHWTADRPGGEPIIKEKIRVRVVFVNGRRAIAEDLTSPTEGAEQDFSDIADLAHFVALAANSVGLSKSSWCPINGGRQTLPSGREVSQPLWAKLMHELATEYAFLKKEGGAYIWAVNSKEAVAFLKALAQGRTENLPPYPA
jgi:hypothetical protein